MAFVSDLADRAKRSAWVGDEPGLADAVGEWVDEVGPARQRLSDEATTVAKPGRVPADRIVQHAAAAGLSRALRTVTRLPSDLQSLAPVRDTQQWAMASGVEAFADQLALSGPSSHEVARIIAGSGALFPGVLRDEIDSRVFESSPVDFETVEAIAHRAFASSAHEVHAARPVHDVHELHEVPLVALPVTQIHAGQLSGGRFAFVRVRRPGVRRGIRADARLSASGASAMSRLMPAAGGMGPIGFVELIVRFGLEETDLRYEALNLVELGLILEEDATTTDPPALRVARPIPGLVTPRALALEHLAGVPLPYFDGEIADPAAVMQALTTITLESALVHGTFWADPAPEHLLVLPGGRLAVIGAGTVGHFSPQLRKAGITFLRSVMSGDAAGQVEAMRIAGAAPADLDVDGLVADLEAADALQVSQILFSGEQGLLDALSETVRVLLRHDLKPPIEVALLLRTVFALDRVSHRIMPEGGGLMAALLGLLPRLPDLLNAVDDEPA